MSDVENSGPTEPGGALPTAEQGSTSRPAKQSENRQPETKSQDVVSTSLASTLQDELGIEEGYGVYKPGGFHPVYIGDTYNGRYLVLSKLGYGLYSTAWLVRDTSSEERKYYALKISRADCYGTDKDIFEREILRHLRDADKSHVGYQYICHLVDDFEHTGPNGTHVCLVLELMGETLKTFGTLFKKTMLPNTIMRLFTFHLLCGLDYAHDSNVIHTDIKPDNIFVKFQDTSLIESQYLKQVPIVVQDRFAEKYSPVQSQSLRRFYFSSGQSLLDFEVALGDWGVASWADNHLAELIQPVLLRAPEVLIKAPWDATTDWWNLGAVILEVFRCVRMFDGRGPPHGDYDLKLHLCEIVAYFGPFPRGLLEKGDTELIEAHFDEAGYVREGFPIELPSLESDDYMDDLDKENRKLFVSFLRALMKIDPQERLSTMDLLRQPWLGLSFG
ncbi:hypothetical protein VMCG_07277 [Cytospora schulzeri]|uniref:non-specific serine/threonine protein kinase n=1 Tax=Cytospora schulzeri TaxID=448051 RepID=A0A423WAF9_9PEZI|nr:hypothetical protein VMCG_07277 [Valsa malicola]